MSPYEDPQTVNQMEAAVIAQDIETTQVQTLPAHTGETAAIIQMIERAALNPAVDIDKMERLLMMQERVMERNAKAAFTAALAVMQPELPVIVERGGIKNNAGKVTSTYAFWEDINEAIKPVLARHGFALAFRTGREGDQIVVTGILSHREGHSEETTMHLPIDGSGSKNAVQAVGSSTSYGKRYTAGALLNLTSRGEDDDGGKGGGDGLDAAVSAATAAINICETGEELREWKAKNAAILSNLPADQANAIVRTFNARVRKLKEEKAS